MNSIRNICSDITLLKILPHLPGANELKSKISNGINFLPQLHFEFINPSGAGPLNILSTL